MLDAGLALLAAFLFAASASLEQHAAHDLAVRSVAGPAAPSGRVGAVVDMWRVFRRLVRQRLWLLGWTADMSGFAVQTIALHLGSVAIVQPILVTQLLFALPMAAAWQRSWPGGRDWLSGVAVCGGLVLFLAVSGVASLTSTADRSRLAWVCICAAVTVALLVLVSLRLPLLLRSTLLAMAAGICFAVSAAMIKLVTDDLLYVGVVATARDWPGYVLAASTLFGLLLEQGALATGSLPTAVATMSITDPVCSYLIGVLAFGVPAPSEPGDLAGLCVAGVLITVGAVGLTRSPIVRRDAGLA